MRFNTAVIFVFLLFVSTAYGQTSVNNEKFAVNKSNQNTTSDSFKSNNNSHNIKVTAERINVFIFSRSNQFNLATFLIKSSASFSALFNKRIKIIKVKSPEDLAENFTDMMNKNKGRMISSLWFDSHGIYKSGNSVLIIGGDTLNYQDIRTERIQKNLSVLSPYCDSETKITIGACYSAATFTRPGNDKLTASRMNGDSLMIGMASIFPSSVIFGSVSWIMTKPFMFGNKWGLAGYPFGYPFGTKYQDEIYEPVWKSVGTWQMYDPSKLEIVPINTVYIGGNGDIRMNSSNYLDSPKVQKKIKKKLGELKPGRFDVEK